jgi:nicotinate-nucleotide adenylyltransferase
MPQTIGILGGTFDPVHNGHLAIAAAAMRQLGLDFLLLIPNARSPLKSSGPIASFPQRVDMLQLAVTAHPEYVVSQIEGTRGNTSYTIDTLRELAAIYPKAEFHLIVGADALADFHLWREQDEIRRLARIAYVGRTGNTIKPDVITATRLEMPPIDVSSTLIRDRVRDGLSIDNLVPPVVAEYIEAHRLYSS